MSQPAFDFKARRLEAAISCRHVVAGVPILLVTHDDEGWQFLCGSEHSAKDLMVVGLGRIVDGDPSIENLATMCSHERAERSSGDSPWKVVDPSEAFIRKCVESPGWSVELISAGETADEPAFAYTIGLFHNYRHAELIVIGLRGELMQAMLNEIAGRIKAGSKFSPGDTLAGVIEGFEVTTRPVLEPSSFRDHVGYARWFYEGNPFPLLQVVYPDMQGRFPGDSGAAEGFKRQQPLLP